MSAKEKDRKRIVLDTENVKAPRPNGGGYVVTVPKRWVKRPELKLFLKRPLVVISLILEDDRPKLEVSLEEAEYE